MSCTSGCLTRNHRSWGDCVKSKNISINDPGGTGSARKWDGDLQAYADAKAQGIQPSGIDRPSIDRAVRISESDGTAFRG